VVDFRELGGGRLKLWTRAIFRMSPWLAVLATTALVGCGAPDSLPVWGELPSFSLSDQNAQSFGSADLAGVVWVADFVFTSCPARCPLLTREMARIQSEIQKQGWDDVRLVSISVDPDTDTPQALADYAKKHQANPELWRFLTGPREEVWNLSVQGFKLPVAEASEPGIGGPILHSNKFVLADRAGQIRGYYDAMEPDQWTQLIDDLRRVRQEPFAVN
jgi:protein SCO1/2